MASTFRYYFGSDSDSDSGPAIDVEPLSHDNYLNWSPRVKFILRREKLWDIVSGAETPPPSTAPPYEITSFHDRQSDALMILESTAPITGLVHCGVRSVNHTDPKVLWDRIRDGYRQRQNVWSIRHELYNIQLEDCEDVVDYTDKINYLVRKYNFAKGDNKEDGWMADDEHTFFYINGLPESWLDAEIGFRLDKTLYDNPEKLGKAMRTYENSKRWLRDEKRRNVSCWKCRGKGHYRNQCPN
jgi:hypothetical protein